MNPRGIPYSEEKKKNHGGTEVTEEFMEGFLLLKFQYEKLIWKHATLNPNPQNLIPDLFPAFRQSF